MSVSASVAAKRAEVAAILQAYDSLKAGPCAGVCIARKKRLLCPLSALVAAHKFGGDFDALYTVLHGLDLNALYDWFASQTGFSSGYVSGFMYGFDGESRAPNADMNSDAGIGYVDGLFVRVALSAANRPVFVAPIQK